MAVFKRFRETLIRADPEMAAHFEPKWSTAEELFAAGSRALRGRYAPGRSSSARAKPPWASWAQRRSERR
jgi:hypothetical protein